MLLFATLTIYLLGTFQHFLLEMAHSISHQFSASHSYHSHNNKQDNNHQHANLDLSKIALKIHASTSIPQDKFANFSFDKIPQLCSLDYFSELPIDDTTKQKFSFQSQIRPSLYLQKLFAPPEVI
jgi:hypothetical protein